MRSPSSALLAVAVAGLTSAGRLVAQAPAVVVSGVVTDSARAPVRDAEVRLMVGGAQTASAYTDAAGRYALHTTAAGPAVLTVRRLGFDTRELSLRLDPARGPTTLDAVLVATPQPVPAVHVVGDPSEANLRLDGFRRRRSLRRGGYFLDLAEIQKARPQRLSDAIRNVPGVRLLASGGIGSAVRFRNCQPLVWIDGVRTPGTELDETVGPNDVAALEVYVSPATVPAQYRDLQNPCGSVLVWTR